MRNPQRSRPRPGARLVPARVANAALAFMAGIALLHSHPAQAQNPSVQPVNAAACEQLARDFSYPGLQITASTSVAAGSVQRPGIAEAMPAHCVVTGKLNERLSPIDGMRYAIGFEMRLPQGWNERFFYQANGGLDGMVVPAFGDILGGGALSNGLLKGFAVLSSDAGHAFRADVPGIGGALFGRDPQARLDYGYNAVAQLTPMAKALITHYYGRAPARSYLVGASNGGRHGMVAAARDSAAYDGILVGAPGFNLPRAAVAQVWGAQQFARISARDPATDRADPDTSFSPRDLRVLADAILDHCDGLDGLRDGIISDIAACQRHFNVARAVPDCQGDRREACLSPAQKAVLATVFAGPRNAQGQALYAPMAWDAGIVGKDWRDWKFRYSVGPRDAVALAFVFTTPPASPEVVSGKGNSVIDYALQFDLDRDAPRIFASDATYTQSAIQFMTLPDPLLQHFVARGGKMMIYHGASDPVFSVLDTIRWYQDFLRAHGAAATNSVRLYTVPGMNHVRGGIATDQFDMVDALVAWVEQARAPEAIVATARGKGAAAVNPEVPADWSPHRTRLLCPYPQVARYQGEGDPEVASSFRCEP